MTKPKYHKEDIISARIFNEKEKKFLDQLLEDKEYTLSAVRDLVAKTDVSRFDLREDK